MDVNELARAASTYGTSILAGVTDADEVVQACTTTLRPHALSPARAESMAARLTHLRVGDFSVNRLGYGGAVTVTPATPDEDNFLITLPVAGRARFRYGNVSSAVVPGGGVIIGPYREFEFTMDPDFDQVIVRLDRTRVESVAATLTDTTGAVHFDLCLRPAVDQLRGLLESAVALAGSAAPTTRPRLAWQLGEVIIESLLLSQPNNRTASLDSEVQSLPSARIRRATDYMIDHLSEQLSIGAVAAECGVGVRSLQAAFRRELDTTPLQWLKARRLERAHTMLSAAVPGLTVTAVAYSCGFLHLGEFSAAFKSRYGITPSAVLGTSASTTHFR